jgi:CxxC motif-containing protein
MSCALRIETGAGGGFSSLSVTGNRCPRGAAYAQEEMLAPKRVVTATCAIAAEPAGRGLYAPRRVPVKTIAPCPREKIPALLADIYKTTITLPVKAGDTVIADWNGEGIKVVAVRTVN